VRAIVAYVPDLMDRSRVSAAADAATAQPSEGATVGGPVRFARTPADLVDLAASADLVVDLSRPGVLDVLPDVSALGVRVIGFGSHVDTDTLAAARAAGCDQVLARSAFFGRLGELLG